MNHYFIARLYLKLERFNLAEVEYSKLIKENPENLEYLKGLQKSRGLDDGKIVSSFRLNISLK